MLWLLLIACRGGDDDATQTFSESEVEDTAHEELWEEVFTLNAPQPIDIEASEVEVIALLGNSDGAVATWIYLGDTVELDLPNTGPYTTTAHTDRDWEAFWTWFADPERGDLSVRIEDAHDGGRTDYNEIQAGFGPEVLDGWAPRALTMEIVEWTEFPPNDNDIVETKWVLYGVPVR